MAIPLPNQGDLLVPIDWQGETANVEMKSGAFAIRGTLGIKPCRETASLSWMVPPDTAKAMLNTFKAGKMNAVYDYTCNVMGDVRIRATGSYGFREVRGQQLVQVTVSFERL